MSYEDLEDNREADESKTLETRPLEELDGKTKVPDGIYDSVDNDDTLQIRSLHREVEASRRFFIFSRKDRRNKKTDWLFLRTASVFVLIIFSFFAGKNNWGNSAELSDRLVAKYEKTSFKELITTFKLSALIPEKKSKFVYMIATKELKVRSEPHVDASIVDKLKDGEGIWIKNSSEIWTEVYKKKDKSSKFVHKIGFVNQSMLKRPDSSVAK